MTWSESGLLHDTERTIDYSEGKMVAVSPSGHCYQSQVKPRLRKRDSLRVYQHRIMISCEDPLVLYCDAATSAHCLSF
jgi:hypothetical protein